jgi:hypothetical protein
MGDGGLQDAYQARGHFLSAGRIFSCLFVTLQIDE